MSVVVTATALAVHHAQLQAFCQATVLDLTKLHALHTIWAVLRVTSNASVAATVNPAAANCVLLSRICAIRRAALASDDDSFNVSDVRIATEAPVARGWANASRHVSSI